MVEMCVSLEKVGQNRLNPGRVLAKIWRQDAYQNIL